jgi:DGQHR domain-containing protein
MTFTYSAIYVQQRAGGAEVPTFAMFCAPVGEVLTWAQISRLRVADEGGHQRPKNFSKVTAIKRFLQFNERNTIPTAITVVLRLGMDELPPTTTCATISIPDTPEDPPGLVIDGQHRLFGMAEFDPTMPVNIVALIDANDDEAAFQFLVINNKATKVSQDHIKLLSLHYAEEELNGRLQSARMGLGRYTSLVGVVDADESSPFFRSVAWPVETLEEGRQALVLPAAIEQALAIIVQRRLPDLEDTDPLLEFFHAVWRVVRESWPELWTPGSRLLSKVGIVTLTTFVIDDLTPLADRDRVNLANPSNVADEVRENILRNLTTSFWTAEWTAKSLDTSAGRQLVVDAIKQMRRNMVRGVPWSENIQLIAAEAAGETSPGGGGR